MHKAISNMLVHKTDLNSMREIVSRHLALLNANQQCKYLRTTDQRTLHIAQQILAHNKFLSDNILSQPNSKLNQTESIVVQICNINRYPKHLQAYRAWKKNQRERIIAVGGPAATDQTMISCMIPEIINKYDINFYCKDYQQSNILHSASQSHARHGSALNADPVLSGRHLLPLVFKRLLFKPSIDQILKSDYIKVDVNLNNFKYIKQYAKNEVNGILQIIKEKLKIMNEHEINRLESVVSQEMQEVIEKYLNIIIRSSDSFDKENSMAIHAIFTKESLKQVENEHQHFKNTPQLKWSELDMGQIRKYFPHSQGILKAFRYHGDYSNPFDMYNIAKSKCTQLRATWSENKAVAKVYVTKDQRNRPIACGVQFVDGSFVPSNKIHLSLGYKAKYIYERSQISPLTSINIPVTGISMNLVIKNTDQIKKLIRQKGRALEIAIVNSHWTIIAYNDDYILMRATAGGNTGSEEYKASYFFNLYGNTKRIFGEAFVGIVSTYGCSRAVNYKNSTQFAQLAQGLVVSYGKGGTGNTKRTSQAYKSLNYLGLGKQISSFFSRQPKNRVDIVKSMDLIMKESEKVNFYYTNQQATLNFLNS